MSLPSVDIAFLNERGIVHEIVPADGMTCVVLPEWPLPAGLDRGGIEPPDSAPSWLSRCSTRYVVVLSGSAFG